MEDLLRQGLPELGIPADDALVTAFAGYLRLLAQWNENINLTGIRELADMVPLHILDSLTARPFLKGQRIVDVGCGAGLPGIPLALTEPARHFTLVDGTLKKIRFVQQAIADLGLANAEALHARIEDHKPVPLYDTAICRALSSLPDFVRRAGSVVAPGGQLLAMKGRLPAEEIRALPKGWRLAAVTPVKIPGVDAERHIIQVVRK
ncbi:MAG: 16S rRNA (guanine(527)-N(7))-methyltransferase RsmG [Chromatiales bacterium]|nr:16S rRNA (guanine(527)-N(7))-methyltransferase RsmG [Chromatiales bacterium]